MRWLWASLIAGLILSGCSLGQIPDPNAYNRGAHLVDGRILLRNIQSAHADLQRRVNEGEISERAKDRMIRELVDGMAANIDPKQVPDDQAFAFADILRQAGRLQDSEALYRRAVEAAQTEDRRINDSLQLARVLALEGKVEEAIKTTRSTFDSDPTEKAPILMAVLYEIVPAGLGKKRDVELADLLLEAIDQQMMVVVDTATEGGENFLAAAPSHVSNAWQTALRIYRDANREDRMRDAIKKRESMARGYGTI